MQKHLFWLAGFILCQAMALAQTPAGWREKIAPQLLAAFDQGETADLLVIFEAQADLSPARHLHGKNARAQFVFARLQETAAQSQAAARRLLLDRNVAANSLYLVNAIAVSGADVQTARLLAELPEVSRLAPDPWVPFASPFADNPQTAVERDAIEWGIQKINAPAVWALGYTGQGITVGGADTGFEWTHPAIQAHYRGWNGAGNPADHDYNWHDAIHELSPLNGDTTSNPANNPCGINIPAPCDDNNHGTHTMGTMVGDDGAGNQIGVAPGASWVACRNMERGWGKPSSYIECFEWFLAPTNSAGQNPDLTKSPDVINNSWYCADIEGCTDLSVNELLRTAVINVKAAGIFVVVSNGNNGGVCFTTSGPPGYFEESFSVGATRQNDTIAGFSSRGPVVIDGSYRIKPNVSAPGVGVRSSIRGGQYANFNGTSMAGPHVAGLVALILSANPALRGEVETVEDIVEQTAVFLADTLDCSPNSPGDARPNHAYGWGRVDALAAVNAALLVDAGQPADVSPGVRVSPNPVAGEALFLLENVRGNTTLEIFAANGQRVVFQSFVQQSSEIRRIALPNAAPGVYWYKVTAENGVAAGKFVKQ